jgi:hypothetical protein
MKSSKNCVVIGPLFAQYDPDKLLSFGDTIMAGSVLQSHTFDYGVVAKESKLQEMINSSAFRQTTLLCTPSLYKKYLFFEQVDCLPSLPTVANTGKKIDDLSEQAISVMLSVWLEKQNVYLFGYDIFDLEERSVLMAILTVSPHTKFFFVRKPNPQKINVFDSYENMNVIDYVTFDGILKNESK